MSRLCGIWGRPYIDLDGVLDTSSFAELDREISYGLTALDVSYTGGSLKWMNVVAPWVQDDGYADLGHVIRGFDRDEFARFVSLADYPSAFDLERFREYTFGDETENPLTRRQMLYLKYQHGVYFPWKVCYHLLENDRWEDKHSGEDKDFADEAREVFPQTVAFIESLPMTEIGRVVIFGLLANDHAPAHRDSEPGKALALAQSISFEPARGGAAGASGGGGGGALDRQKRFYVTAPDGTNEVEVTAPIYWFNDMDWHGVHADPFFRYSVRVDGVFEPEFLEKIRRNARSRR